MTSSPKASIWPILPSSQTWYDSGSSSTSCPTVSCQAPAAAGLKGQLNPACEVALLLAVPTQPAGKHFPVRGQAFISQQLQTHWQVVRQRQQDSRFAPAASEQAGPAGLRHQLGKAKEGEALLCWQQKRQGSVKAFQGTSLLVCKGLASC